MGEMKATDLRAGNLVLHNKQMFVIHDIISTQDSVIIGQGDDTGGFQEVFISEIEPVIIGIHNISFFDFKCVDGEHYYYEHDYIAGLFVLRNSWIIYSIDSHDVARARYMHEVQNLLHTLLI